MATDVIRVPKSFIHEELNYMKANSIFNNVVRYVLYFIFQKGCPKPSGMAVPEYLLTKRGLSREKLKRFFLKEHIRKMEEDPDGETFDLSLLYLCIQKACPNVAVFEDPIWKTASNTFENVLYSLKQERNSLVHDKLYLTSDELKILVNRVHTKLEVLIREAKVKFNIPNVEVDDLISKTEEDIGHIMFSSAILGQSCEETEDLKFKNELILRINVKSELLRCLQNSPFFIDLCEVAYGIQEATKVSLNEVFTDPELVEVQKQIETSRKINYKYILDEMTYKSRVIILEGVAGSGKTTLVKKILSDWINGRQQAHSLSQFELLLHADCRSNNILDFGSLLQSLLPEMSSLMSIDDLKQAVLNLKTLIVLDGLDWTLHYSSSFLKDIFHHQTTQDRMQVLIVTRPEKTSVCYKIIPAKLDVYHAKINGISVDRRVEFISKLGRAVEKLAPKRKGGKRKEIEQNVTSLITYFSTTPWLLDHFGLPVHLHLLTILSLQNGEVFQYLKTPTSLYTAILKVMKDKLVERLLASGSFVHGMEKEAIKEHVDEFLEVLFLVSLTELNQDTLSLSFKSLELLIKACFDFELPQEEMLHAFLSVKRHFQDGVFSLKVSFPHKGIQEYYAACAVLAYLSQGEKKKVIRRVVKDIRKTLLSNSVPAGVSSEIIQLLEETLREKLNTKPTVEQILKDLENDSTLNLCLYQKVLIHLIGLLKVKSKLTETLARELVSVLKRTNLLVAENWLDIITQAECDPFIVSEVGSAIPKGLLCVRDGNLMAALLLLRENIDFENVELHIASDPQKLPELKLILDILANRKIQLKITFLHHWKFPELGSSDELLKSVSGNLSRNGGKLYHFTGSLKKLSTLGTGVELLNLAVGSRYAKYEDRDLGYLQDLVNVEFLCIHIVGGLPLASLPELPRPLVPVDLWFSDTNDSNIEWIGKAIRSLLGTKVYRQLWSIRFPRSKFSAFGCEKLARHLKGFIIGKSGVWVSSKNLSLEHEEYLQEVYHRELNQKFCLTDEINIWTL